QNKLRQGEKIVDKLDFIEDTKGNVGDKGRLIITNLRIIWHSLTISRISLSIGFNCILSASTKVVNSKLHGTTEALHLLTKSGNSRFEFIFTNLVSGNTRHFTSVMGVHKAYLSSRAYRELKLRGAVIRNKQLKILPLEQIYSTLNGVWNLSSDQGNLGSFIITNIRLVWYAEMNENFNISLPHVQVATVKMRDSKFGPALVVESRASSGGYVLGFRLDPIARLNALAKQLKTICQIHSSKPEFGVQYTLSDQAVLAEEAPVAGEEVEELADDEWEGMNGATLFYAVGRKSPSPPVYCKQLGLAVEPPCEGYTIDTLWQVLPNPDKDTPLRRPAQDSPSHSAELS
ncbi:hypothetical protein AAG570_008822, partial [Ranatra chinensis]